MPGARVRLTSPARKPGYFTDFDLTENPISEGGFWHANALGLIRSDIGQGAGNSNVVTASGFAHGTSSAASASQFDDSFAVLDTFGRYGANYSVTAVFHKVAAIGGTFSEIEILGRGCDTGTYMRCYEVLAATDGSYCGPVRWNGDGTFTTTASQGTFAALADGDVVNATFVGNTITFSVRGAQIYSFDTTTFGAGPLWTDGNPGMGFDTDGADANYGLKSYQVQGL